MECDGTFGPGFRQTKMYGGVTSVDEISRWLCRNKLEKALSIH